MLFRSLAHDLRLDLDVGRHVHHAQRLLHDLAEHRRGEIAAPVFSQVVQQTLRMMNVAPDIEVKPQIVGKPVAAEQESF